MEGHHATDARLAAAGKIGPSLRLMPTVTAMTIHAGKEPPFAADPFRDGRERIGEVAPDHALVDQPREAAGAGQHGEERRLGKLTALAGRRRRARCRRTRSRARSRRPSRCIIDTRTVDLFDSTLFVPPVLEAGAFTEILSQTVFAADPDGGAPSYQAVGAHTDPLGTENATGDVSPTRDTLVRCVGKAPQ